MFARVVSWEGADPATLGPMLDEIKSQAAAGPPEGVPASGMLLLSDREAGRTMMIACSPPTRTGAWATRR